MLSMILTVTFGPLRETLTKRESIIVMLTKVALTPVTFTKEMLLKVTLLYVTFKREQFTITLALG